MVAFFVIYRLFFLHLQLCYINAASSNHTISWGSIIATDSSHWHDAEDGLARTIGRSHIRFACALC